MAHNKYLKLHNAMWPGLGHFLSFREPRCWVWGRLFSLRTRFLTGPVGRIADCGQECPPHTNHEKALVDYEKIIAIARSRARLRPGSLFDGNGPDSGAPKMETLLYTHGFLDVNGVAIHGHGACRAGNEPKRNNPTLTILALAYCGSDYVADEIGAGRV